MKLSVELRLLAQMVKQELCQNDAAFDIEGIDWETFHKTCSYHNMRSLAFVANQKQSVLPEQLAKKYQNFTKWRASKNLENVIEIKRLYDLFTREGIHPVLLKGMLFTATLYQNQTLREGSDIDFLFKKEDSKKGIEMLLADGYDCHDWRVLSNAQHIISDIHRIIFEANFKELHFEKNTFNLDFHWALCKPIVNYNVDLDIFFKDLKTLNFYGKEIQVTNPNALFWSLVLHHGGKELWLKFKNLVDLIAFMVRYQSEVDWKFVIQQAKEFNLLVSMKTGFYLIKHVFDYPLPPMLEQEIQGFKPKKLDQIVAFWNGSKHWYKIIPRWKYEKILHHSQDEGYTFLGYMYKLYHTSSIPYPSEDVRLFNIPPSWTLLNLLNKLISYLLRKR